MDLFRVRINCIDHYQATPTRYDPQLRNDVRLSQVAKEPKVPVIRVFGSTEIGQKVCAHIHGVFPYLYIEYSGQLDPDEVGAYIYKLHLSIDHALAVSYRRDQNGQSARFVARITLVKGIPFYGYHVGYRFFLKIYLFNPIYMTRLADLLQQGVILKQKFQPFEAHLQYISQFMTDYNLYGCDYLDAKYTFFRSPVPKYDQGSVSGDTWHDRSIAARCITDELALPRVSHCSLEVDISAQDILNRLSITARHLHHDFIERNEPIPADLKLVHSMAGLWADEAARRKRQMPSNRQEAAPFTLDALASMSAEPHKVQAQNWIHEEEFREQIANLEQEEMRLLPDGENLAFENYVRPNPLEYTINTALQSVEDLYSANLMPALGLPSNVTTKELSNSIEVDEHMALQSSAVGEDFYLAGSEEEEALKQFADGHGDEDAQPQAGDPDELIRDNSLENIGGVCASGFKTNKVPTMMISTALINAAEDGGHIARAAARGGASAAAEGRVFKRTISNISSRSLQNQPKRGKTTQEKAYGESTMNPEGDPLRNSASSQGDRGSNILLSQDQKLNFSIVKNQNDPHTKFRLSQKAHQLTNSQMSFDGYRVTPPLPIQADATIGSQAEKSQFHLSFSRDQLLLSSPSPHISVSQHSRLLENIAKSTHRQTLVIAAAPPVLTSKTRFEDSGIPDVVYQDAFYSNEKDVPVRNREYAGREFRLESNTLPFLPDFDPLQQLEPSSIQRADQIVLFSLQSEERRRMCTWRSWEIAAPPPTASEVSLWLDAEGDTDQLSQSKSNAFHRSSRKGRLLSQIEGPTPKNKHGIKYTQKSKTTSVKHEVQYMSTMSLEIHVNTRGKLVPNPEEDEIQCIFWSCKGDDVDKISQTQQDAIPSGIILLDSDGSTAPKLRKITAADVIGEDSELNLLTSLVDLVRTIDPDILTGYEVHGGSWGYLMERARLKYEYNLCDELSRMKTESHGRFGKQNDRWGFNTTSTIRVTGRHMINIWRAMRSELGLLQYTMENVAWQLLHVRIPHFSFSTLTNWYKSGKPYQLAKLLRYYMGRVRVDIDILDANELIPRTSEQARLLGVDFFSVFSRGSQFKVESIMFRIAKPENFILVSPSKKQVGGQNALECLPLVMEPQSAFYNSPLLVLDFQSLYPSVMIAYNYCYSTFLGRIMNWRGESKMGFTEYKRQQGLLALLKDYINIAPNGMMFVKSEIRKSLLAKMLTEILETRVMIKSGMKQDKDDKTLQQLLNNRQLALKLLANVTYGYTSASFSGRMPCSEIADSIVQTGRETLERAIAYIHSVERWGAEVVYGDTDSLFVYLKGRTKDEAFDIGNEIAQAVTDMNPKPVKLKFEKVYLPCVLLAKKRYVGYMYETTDQLQPQFDAKGIETVRRDGTPAEQKIEEKALRLLFETADLSQIKQYFQRQCDKIMRGNVSVQDFCFAKEVRLGSYSDKGPPPAGALISTRRMLEDARAEPQYGERVPYVVVSGAPGARLIDRCVAPEDLLANPHWQLDSEYYISKNLIPPLERIFNLVGANVRQWYDEMPKIQRIHHTVSANGKRSTLESYMKSTHCLVCTVKFTSDARGNIDQPTQSSLCPRCRSNISSSLFRLQTRLDKEEKKYQSFISVCRNCTGHAPLDDVRCDSQDCSVFWSRMKQKNKVITERSRTKPVIQDLVESARLANLDW